MNKVSHYLDFKLLPRVECRIVFFGQSPGVRAFSANISLLSIRSIFIGIEVIHRIWVEGYKYRKCLGQSWLEPIRGRGMGKGQVLVEKQAVGFKRLIFFGSQTRIIRIITNSKNRNSCRGLFKNLKILPLYSQYIYSLSLFGEKTKNNINQIWKSTALIIVTALIFTLQHQI